jgi:hypothetical protein
VAVCALVGAAALWRLLLAATVGPIHPPLGPDRWAAFQADAHRIDTVFVGSSRVLRHVDPEIVDRVMAAGGHPTVSFNAGMPAGSVLESWYILENILAEGAPVKTVVLEPNDFNTLIQNRHAPRVIAAHAPHLFPRYVTRAIRNDKRLQKRQERQERHGRRRRARRSPAAPPADDREGEDDEDERSVEMDGAWSQTRAAVEATWLNVSNQGRLAHAAFPPLDRQPEPNLRGFRALDVPPMSEASIRRAADFARERRFVPRVRRNQRATQRRRFARDETLLRDLNALIDWLQAREIEVVLLSPPNGAMRDAVFSAWQAHERGLIPELPFLIYNHPGRAEGLLDRKYWHDRSHMNGAGAGVFSQMLAEDLLEWRRP